MYLLDTNVVSELRKVRAGKAAPAVAHWADTVQASELYLSVVTVEELKIGVLLVERRDPRQGALLRAWLSRQVQPAFAGRILPIGNAMTPPGRAIRRRSTRPSGWRPWPVRRRGGCGA